MSFSEGKDKDCLKAQYVDINTGNCKMTLETLEKFILKTLDNKKIPTLAKSNIISIPMKCLTHARIMIF